jgi:hypothetical protein
MTGTVSQSNRLPELAAAIRLHHEGVEAAARTAAEHAIAAGHALIEAKAMLKHGQWLSWLKEHCGLQARSAQGYMQLARSGLKCETVAHLGLKVALESLREKPSKPVPVEEVIPGYTRPPEPGEVSIPVADVVVRLKVYPRDQVYPDLIRRYAEFIADLPPIEINQRYELIDGLHRLKAHESVGAETILAVVTETADDFEHAMLAAWRNSRHGEQLPIQVERRAKEMRQADTPWPKQRPDASVNARDILAAIGKAT